MKNIYLLLIALSSFYAKNTLGQNGIIYVDITGLDLPGNGTLVNPYATINYALQQQSTNDTAIYVFPGTYDIQQTILITHPVVIRNYNNSQVFLDAANWSPLITGKTMMQIMNTHDVTIRGLTFRNCTGPQTNGIIVMNDPNSSGPASNITIRNCTLTNIGWTSNDLTAVPTSNDNAHAIYVLSNSYDPVTNLLLEGNTVSNCATGYSEAVTLQGNVDGFTVQGNEISEVSNIGMDIAGNYGYAPAANIDRVRNGHVRYNNIHHCMSPVAMSAGLYLDGSASVRVYGNHIHHNAVGISVGGERATAEVLGKHNIYNNVIDRNAVTGLLIGTGDSNSTNPVVDTRIYNNTFFKNTMGQAINGVDSVAGLPVDTYAMYSAEVALHNTDSVYFQNNIFCARTTRRCMLAVDHYATTHLVTDHNNYHHEDNAPLITIGNNVVNFNSLSVTGDFYLLPIFNTYTGLEAGSVMGAPNFTDTLLSDFSLTDSSAAINMGGAYNSAYSDTIDYAGMPRLYGGIIDAGAYEFQSDPLSVPNIAAKEQLHLYPNPAHGEVTIELPAGNKAYKASVLDILGRDTGIGTSGSGNYIKLSMESLSPGNYFIKLSSDGTVSFHQVTVY